MRRFADLLASLAAAPHAAARRTRWRAYLDETPLSEQGWAIAWALGMLTPPRRSAAWWRKAAEARVDHELFGLSAQAIGDIGETAALIWPGGGDIPLADIVAGLNAPDRLMDSLDAEARLAVTRLTMGRKPRGVKLAELRDALAQTHERDPLAIAGALSREAPPFTGLFAWLRGDGAEPDPPIRPPEIQNLTEGEAPPDGPWRAWPAPEGQPVAVVDGAAFNSDGFRIASIAAENGWGFLSDKGYTPAPMSEPLDGDLSALRHRHGDLFLRTAEGEFVIWPAPHRSLTCPVGFIELGRALILTLMVDDGGEPAPLVKLPIEGAECGAVASYARKSSVGKFGPVRQVGPGLWATVVFRRLASAPRRKIGFTLTDARIESLCWADGPPAPTIAEVREA